MCCTFDKNIVAIVTFLYDLMHFEKNCLHHSSMTALMVSGKSTPRLKNIPYNCMASDSWLSGYDKTVNLISEKVNWNLGFHCEMPRVTFYFLFLWILTLLIFTFYFC